MNKQEIWRDLNREVGMAFVFVRTFEVFKLTKYAVVPRCVSLFVYAGQCSMEIL